MQQRWVSPSAGRGSNGWYPRIVWPYGIYGLYVDLVIDLRTMQPVDLVALDPAVQSALLAARLRSSHINDRGDTVLVIDGVLRLTFLAEGSTRDLPLLPGWNGDGVIAYRRGEPWVWSGVAGGPNEQFFAYGRPLDGDPRGLFVEMPCLDLQAAYEEATDTWALSGFAMGSHGTPDYQDGVCHFVTGVPASSQRTELAPHLTPFGYPIRLPDAVADVWTFGDDIPGTIGGGEQTDRPNRQGIGLWPDGRPWLNLDRPVLGVWISPYDAQQGLRMFPDESKFLELVRAYRVEALTDELLTGYRAERSAGGWNFAALEERIAIEICRRTGCSLTIYDDHALMEVPGSEGTRYRPELLERAFALQRQGLGVVMAIKTYPDDQAGWSFEDCARALRAGPDYFGDSSGRPAKTGFDWLQLTEPGNQPMPVVFTLACYTRGWPDRPQHWPPSTVARRLEEMVRTGMAAGVIGFDVFGVKRGGEAAEWNAWGDRWVDALIARAQPQGAAWPRSTIAAAPAPAPPAAPAWNDALEQAAGTVEDRARKIRDRHDG